MNLKKPNAIVLDIEGTTTSPKFVSEVLFPFIRSHLKKYLKENWGKSELEITIERLKEHQKKEIKAGLMSPLILNEEENNTKEIVLKSVVSNVLWQMNEKKKNTPLKQIQILVWVYGYEKGYLQGHIYEDVPGCLHYWKKYLNIKLYIYSTGMILAQQLLFSCSTFGNLLPLIDDYFDVLIGSKVSSESYLNISREIKEKPENILFLTDSPKEGYAAQQAGLMVVLVQRPENKPLSETDLKIFHFINSFEELNFIV